MASGGHFGTLEEGCGMWVVVCGVLGSTFGVQGSQKRGMTLPVVACRGLWEGVGGG